MLEVRQNNDTRHRNKCPGLILHSSLNFLKNAIISYILSQKSKVRKWPTPHSYEDHSSDAHYKQNATRTNSLKTKLALTKRRRRRAQHNKTQTDPSENQT
ncbi:hypothetical protein F2P56_020644 [Juglans regia]|uniref:Uncharacterized protein n=1 Tax=Juglans regia TaxID=51240 RepID=A0A833UDF8_JUGRE|nr:hypothetical protein F2P56_020644 [Juglans regia]